ncbi:MAG: hypothetical protein ABI358_12210 [Ginsengibacter sp.]
MNFHFLWHDVQHGLFHFDKGVLYTTKQLFTRPAIPYGNIWKVKE